MAGECYKKNFIKKVIAKIDFAEPVSLFTPESIAEAVAEIKTRFPISEQATAFHRDIHISKDEVKSSKLEFPQWIFHGEERTKRLSVNQLTIEVLLTKYSSEDDFKNDLIIPISQLLKISHDITIKRTGIRFVNVFDFLIDDFPTASKYFSKSITNHLSVMDEIDKCSRSFLINEFLFEDIRLRVQTGFFNPDYPAIIKRNHFVIDLDAYIDIPHLINDSESYFKILHDKIEEKFEQLITEKLRKEILDG
jgi:uncharacterized protein (TIGR04255 family)